ncbi:hypothetical protein EOL73_02690 [Candidatus Saccharibacteria bacterium]|nr:hypothetical protein [Candidatus Saccharibacteria bacterium]
MNIKVESGLHFVRKHILRTLSQTKWARFRDMKPKNVDSNLYSYHLKELLKEGYIERNDTKGYRLSPFGLRFVNQISMEVFEPRWQPKIMTVLVCVNSKKILLWKKFKQPYIDTWALPGGKMHYDDASVQNAAIRDILFYSSRVPDDLKHVGIFGYRVFIKNELISYSFAHVYTGTLDTRDFIIERPEWVDIQQLGNLELSPGVLEIIELVDTNKSFFFADKDINW